MRRATSGYVGLPRITSGSPQGPVLMAPGQNSTLSRERLFYSSGCIGLALDIAALPGISTSSPESKT
jgi:hypothetical protein